MNYIQLSNDSFIISTNKGTKTFTKKSFNYNKIKNMAKKGAKEEEILPLLEGPEISDKIYHAYIFDSYDLFISRCIRECPKTGDVYSSAKVIEYGNADDTIVNNIVAENLWEDDSFVGVYANIEDMCADWPEYIL